MKPELDFLTEAGENCYLDVCRFASDTLRGPDPFEEHSATEDPNAWVKIAANFMPWIWMLNPLDIAAWIGRSDIMFRQLPEIDEKVKARVVTMHASDRYLAPGATLDELRQSDGAIGYSDKLRHGETGKGLNDYHAIFRILAAVGFTGWISVEDGISGMDELRRSVEFLKRMRATYFV